MDGKQVSFLRDLFLISPKGMQEGREDISGWDVPILGNSLTSFDKTFTLIIVFGKA